MTTIGRLALASLLLLPLSACASRTTTMAAGQTFTGEVWTWDSKENIVTLRRGAEDIRIKTTPDQVRGLQLHSIATIRGEVAPPAEIATVITGAGPMTAVLRGAPTQQMLTGTVTAVDPAGRLSIDSERGPLHVWAAAGANERFKPGDRVTVAISVQPVDMVPARAGGPSAADPSASPSSQPGDSAVVTGRVMGVDRGLLVVESPSGPIQVWAGEPPRYTLTDHVQVRTNVTKAQ